MEKNVTYFTNPSFLIISAIAACALAPDACEGAVTIFRVLDYHGRSSSPFFSGLQNGSTFIEDFRDRTLDLPGVSMPYGSVHRSAGYDIDEDDGAIDGLTAGGGTYWQENGRVPNPNPYTFEIRFSPDVNGQYPLHAGFAVLGLPAPSPYTWFIRALDSSGLEITGGRIEITVPAVPPGTHPLSTVSHAFLGLYADQGIHRLEIYNVSLIDHIQFGYGVPEPGAAGLAVFAAAFLCMHRSQARRTGIHRSKAATI